MTTSIPCDRPAESSAGRRAWLAVALAAVAFVAATVAVGATLHWPGALVPLCATLLMLAAERHYLRKGRAGVPLAETAQCAALAIAFTNLAGPLSYYAAMTPFPLVDEHLARFDRLLGFDWNAWRNLVAERPALRALLGLFYWSSLPQLVVLIVILPRLRTGRARELVEVAIYAITATIALSALLPAQSAWLHYRVDVDWAYHAEVFLALRQGNPPRIFESGTIGVVTFPSLHVGFALFTIWAARGIRVLWPIAVLLNAGVIVSLPTQGGHYVVDVLAGAAVTACAIALRAVLHDVAARRLDSTSS